MPETPDFDQIARNLFRDIDGSDADAVGADDEIADIVEQLRLVWNARGAADCAKLDDALVQMPPFPQAGPYVKLLDRALRSLDR